MCEKTRYAVKSPCNVLLSEFLFGESSNLIFPGRFKFSTGFGHSPKYYPPIIAVSHFAKVFSLQNFVSYGSACYIILIQLLQYQLGPVCYKINTNQ